MSQAAKAQEPSMEEILASIRRIIADDESKPAKPEPVAAAPAPPPPVVERAPPPRPVEPPRPAPPPVAAEPEPVADVLDLTEAMAAAPPAPQPSSSFRTIDGESDVVFSDRPPEPEPIRAVEEARRQFTQTTDRSLMSNSTMAAVDSAFSSLAHTVLGNNARTLEDLVKEMLRPMLKSWLDDNLPGLVERLVRAEIERVSRGRG
jgi:cell pole-organizing protein PopZ